jgi:hypothetical protein
MPFFSHIVVLFHLTSALNLTVRAIMDLEVQKKRKRHVLTVVREGNTMCCSEREGDYHGITLYSSG